MDSWRQPAGSARMPSATRTSAGRRLGSSARMRIRQPGHARDRPRRCADACRRRRRRRASHVRPTASASARRTRPTSDHVRLGCTRLVSSTTVQPRARSTTRDVPVNPVWPTVAGPRRAPMLVGSSMRTPRPCRNPGSRCVGQLVGAHLRDGRLRAGPAPRRARHRGGSSRPGVPGQRPCRTCRHARPRHPATRRSRRGRCPGACPARRTTRPPWPRSVARVSASGRNPLSVIPSGAAHPLDHELRERPTGTASASQPGGDEAEVGIAERRAGATLQGRRQHGRATRRHVRPVGPQVEQRRQPRGVAQQVAERHRPAHADRETSAATGGSGRRASTRPRPRGSAAPWS